MATNRPTAVQIKSAQRLLAMMIDNINAFDSKTNEDEHTDTGEAWALLDDIRAHARMAFVDVAGHSHEEKPITPPTDEEHGDEEDDMPNGCAECARSFGPHYRGICPH